MIFPCGPCTNIQKQHPKTLLIMKAPIIHTGKAGGLLEDCVVGFGALGLMGLGLRVWGLWA